MMTEWWRTGMRSGIKFYISSDHVGPLSWVRMPPPSGVPIGVQHYRWRDWDPDSSCVYGGGVRGPLISQGGQSPGARWFSSSLFPSILNYYWRGGRDSTGSFWAQRHSYGVEEDTHYPHHKETWCIGPGALQIDQLLHHPLQSVCEGPSWMIEVSCFSFDQF